MKKVVVVGGGLAGMAAGIKVMEERPGTQVTLYNIGHHMGGKASSYRDDLGFNIDHGFHALASTYKRMIPMLERAGVVMNRAMVKDQGTYFYDPDKNVIVMTSGFGGDPSDPDAQKMSAFFMKNMKTIVTDPDIEQFDDICWTAWAIENGLPEELTRKPSFRFSKDALFNWPYEVSAYINFKSIRNIMGSTGFWFPNGAYNEQLIMPLVKYFQRLGGTLKLYHKLVEVLHEGGRVTGLRFAQPDFNHHNHGEKKWDREVKVLPEITEVTGFDHAVITVPVDSLRELNKGDAGFWRGFPGIENLQSVATLTLDTWTEKPVFEHLPNCINLLDEPLPMVIDYKYVRDEYTYNKNFGSVLQWVGQENTFEEYSDEDLIARAYDCLARIPEATDPRECGIIHEVFKRNSSNHQRYLLTEPGTVQFRPHSKTHLANLFLAGDWIRNEVEVPTMEGAVCSGFTAVEEMLKVF